MKNTTVSKMVKAAILSAVAAVLMYFDFYIGFAIMKFDFSDVAALIGAFALGPAWGVAIELLKNLLILLFKGSSTGFVGEFANFIVGAAYVLPAGLVYKYRKNRRGAQLGTLVGTLSMIVFAGFANYYILVPFYMNAMKFPLDKIFAMTGNSMINSMFTYILYLVVPFNFVKAAVVSGCTFVLYKHISKILH